MPRTPKKKTASEPVSDVRPVSPSLVEPFLLRGAFAELYFEESEHTALRWDDGRLDEIRRGRNAGAGLRYLEGRQCWFGPMDATHPVTRGLTGGEQARLAAIAKTLGKDLKPVRTGIDWKPLDARTHPMRRSHADVPLQMKAAMLAHMDKIARDVMLVTQVTINYGERYAKLLCVNSDGGFVREDRTQVTLSVQVTAKKGEMTQTAYESVGGVRGWEIFDDDRALLAAETAAKRAVAKVLAPPAPLGEMPVVIASQAGGTLVHEAVGHALEADGIQQGASPYFAGKIGKKVATPLVTVLDDPSRPGQRGSFYFDDEGTPSESTVLIDKGVLRTYLYDRRTALQDNRPPNGHGRRESHAHVPIPRMSNTFIAPGSEDPAAILASLHRGLYVTRMGGGQVDIASGDFVFEVEEGHLVENGRVRHMVRGATLLGNTAEVLKNIDRVGSDLGWSIGTCVKDGQGAPVSDGLPTLRISKILVGGTDAKS